MGGTIGGCNAVTNLVDELDLDPFSMSNLANIDTLDFDLSDVDDLICLNTNKDTTMTWQV